MRQYMEQGARLSLYRFNNSFSSHKPKDTFNIGLHLLNAAAALYQQGEYALMCESIDRAVQLENIAVIHLAAKFCIEERFGEKQYSSWLGLLEDAAGLGDAQSMFVLAQYYSIAEIESKAGVVYSLLIESARLEYSAALIYLSYNTAKREDIAEDKRNSLSIDMLRQACALGNVHAQYELAFKYLFGYIDLADDFSNVLNLLNCAGENGFEIAHAIALQVVGLIDVDIKDINGGCYFENKIAYGAYADIYIGEFHNESVAVKVFKPYSGLADRLEMELTTKQEITVLSMLSAAATCPYLVQLIGIKFNSNYPVIVLHRYESSLCTFLQSEKLNNLDECRLILKGLCAAVSYLHNLGILHFDIKMQNILIYHKHGKIIPVLTDFGSSELIPDNSVDLMRLVARAGRYTTNLYCAYEFLSADRFAITIRNQEEVKFSTSYNNLFRCFNNDNEIAQYRNWLLNPNCLLHSVASSLAQAKVVALKKLDIFSLGMVMFLLSHKIKIDNLLPHSSIHCFFSKLIGSADNRYSTTESIVCDWDKMLKTTPG